MLAFSSLLLSVSLHTPACPSPREIRFPRCRVRSSLQVILCRLDRELSDDEQRNIANYVLQGNSMIALAGYGVYETNVVRQVLSLVSALCDGVLCCAVVSCGVMCCCVMCGALSSWSHTHKVARSACVFNCLDALLVVFTLLDWKHTRRISNAVASPKRTCRGQ